MDALITQMERLAELGLVVTLLVVIYGGARGWWVFGATHQSKIEECDRERARGDAAEEQYAALLRETIEQYQKRDRTLETLSQVVRGKAE